jgi:RHS repeat-associated protein
MPRCRVEHSASIDIEIERSLTPGTVRIMAHVSIRRIKEKGRHCRAIARIVIAAHIAGMLPAPLLAGEHDLREHLTPDAAAASATPTAEARTETSGAATTPYGSPASVVVNRSRPKTFVPPLFAGFSARPSDADFFKTRVFREVLVPVGRATAAAENAALGAALNQYTQSRSPDAIEPILTFLDQHPDSPWRASLLVNVGFAFKASGAYRRALSAWDEAWRLAKSENTDRGRAVANRAVGEWLALSMSLQQRSAVATRLREIDGRDVHGGAAERIAWAREQLHLAKRHPDLFVPSASLALERLLHTVRPGTSPAGVSVAMPSALTPLIQKARQSGLSLRPGLRSPGASFVAPSLVYFKTGQVVALLEQYGESYLMYDATTHSEIWIRQRTLEEEADRYGIVPTKTPVAAWRSIALLLLPASTTACPPGAADDQEPPPSSEPEPEEPDSDQPESDQPDPDKPDSDKPDSDRDKPEPDRCRKGMATYRFHPTTAGLLLHDVPAGYEPPRGPEIHFGVSYHSREEDQPDIFTFSNLGPRWRLDWLGYLEDYPASCHPITGDCYQAQVQVMLRAGGVEVYEGANAQGVYPPHWRTRAVLARTSSYPLRYERRRRDGSVEVYGLPDGAPATGVRRVFLTELIDRQGQAVQLTYDAQFRLTAITDALGQVSTLSYEHAADPLKITKITDPFGRFATFTYTADGHLGSITDVIGLTSSFVYGLSDFVLSLTTPYGRTTFQSEAIDNRYDRFIEATDPLGGRERLEYHVQDDRLSGTAPASEVPIGFSAANRDLNRYVTLAWNKRAMALHPGDASAATVTRWLLTTSASHTGAVSVRVPQSIKRPLEGRVWYLYPGQTPAVGSDAIGSWRRPTTTARVLDDGASQIWQATYNDQGRVTSRVDPLGRRTSYFYASNGFDLTEVRQTTGTLNDLLVSYGSYTTQHQPQTMTDAAGQTTTLTYNAAGQLTAQTNAKGETTSYFYDASGYPSSIQGPLPAAVTTYSYDGYGRPRTVTEADGYFVTIDYDALNRRTKVTFPDGTYEEVSYDKLDVARYRDRLGRLTYIFHDALRRIVSVRDPLGSVIVQQWCDCGSLDAIIDGNGHRTSWERDLLGRVVRTVRADGTTARTYTYEAATSRVKTIRDAKSQVRTYTYDLANDLVQIAYTNTAVTTTPVSYTFEADYDRVSTITDGAGTVAVTYKPAGTLGAGKLGSIDGVLANDTASYDYDELGRVTTLTLNGSTIGRTYDSLSRVATETNTLGSFTFSYDGMTNRLASIVYPNGQSANYTYLSSTNDRRVQTVQHKRADGSTLAQFDYAYDAVGNVLTWRQQVGSETPVSWSYTYDVANELLTAHKWTTTSPAGLLRRYSYTYDRAGNRTTEQIDDQVTLSTYDVLNRLTKQQAGGALRVAGLVNEPATVSIQGNPAVVTSEGRFTGAVQTIPGSTPFTIEAIDASGNRSQQAFQIDTAAQTRTFAYDANGNLTSDGTRTFEWDARDRLSAIGWASYRDEVLYNALRQRIKLTHKISGAAVEDVTYAWCTDAQLCEARSSTGSTTRDTMFGVARSTGGSSFYLRDHLGTVWGANDSAGTINEQFAYEPYGRRETLVGSDTLPLGFAKLQPYDDAQVSAAYGRFYDSSLGRWLSEDPQGMKDGLNLYAYVHNSPVKFTDPSGFGIIPPWLKFWKYFKCADAAERCSQSSKQCVDDLKQMDLVDVCLRGAQVMGKPEGSLVDVDVAFVYICFWKNPDCKEYVYDCMKAATAPIVPGMPKF